MRYKINRDKKHLQFGSDLNESSLVAVRYSGKTVVLLYTREWDALRNSMTNTGRLYLSSISREFEVRNNSIVLDREFSEHLGKGIVHADSYPKGIILRTHESVKDAA